MNLQIRNNYESATIQEKVRCRVQVIQQGVTRGRSYIAQDTSGTNLVDKGAELGDGVLVVADDLEGGLLVPRHLPHLGLL